MVASFDDMEAPVPTGIDDRLDLISGPERVTAPLHEQHRRGDRREVRIPPAFGSSWRVQGVSEEDESVHIDGCVIAGRNLRRDTTAHR